MNNQFSSSELCNEETAFCGTSTVGISSENCSSSDVNNPVPLFDTYLPIYTTTLNVDVGYNMVVLSPEKIFEYLPGDILGWIKTSSGATLAVGSNHSEYNVLVTVTSLPTGNITLSTIQRNSKQTGAVLIAGVASKPTAFIANITALSTPGVKNITFTHQTSEETLILNRSISALHPVGNISFTTASNSCVIYGPLNEAFNISINFHGGTNAHVMWRANNITVGSYPYLTLGNQDETTWQQNFTFFSIREYPLLVMVTNGVGGKLLTATVIIQEKITGLTATKADANKVAYQGLSTQLNVSHSTGNNVTYKWYFGDGSDTVTVADNVVDHSYHKFGLINTTVEATNMVSSVNYSFIVIVSNPVVIIVPAYAVSNVSTKITCKLAENLLETYIIALQVDNESLTASNCNTIEHVFTPGIRDIHCYIHAAVVLYSNTSLFVVEPITGLSILDIPPLALDTKYTVKANISAGNNVTFVWQVLEQKYDAYLNSSYPITFNQHGQISLKVNASNAISNMSAETILTVQVPIGKLSINPSANPAKTDDEIYFVINQTAGTEVNYTVNISTSEYYQDLGPTATFTYTFPQEGTYNIFISATNLISSSNTTFPITAQVPIKRRPEITCPSISKDKTCVVSTTELWSFKAEIPYATNVTFEWTWGGEQDTTTDYTPSISPSNITSTENKSFPDPKTFHITVIAKNNVSNLSNVLHVGTLDKVSGITLKFPQAVAVNTNFTINASIAKGSNVTYSYDFGDERKNIVADQTVSLKYEKVGVYQIKGNASNLLSNNATSQEIIIQQEITGVSIEKIDTVETNKLTTITWAVSGGTNVTSELSFGDATNNITNYMECELNDSTSTYNCDTTHKWSKSGTYEVRIHAKNLLTTTKDASIDVTVQDPVEGFSVAINSSSTYYEHEAISLIFTQKGSSVKYQINYGDEGRTENTSDTNFDIKYYKKGNYTPWFKAYNDISISTKTYINSDEIKIEIPPEPKEIKGLKISVKPTKFNTTTEFDVSYESGALFKCTINFGDDTPVENILEARLNEGTTHRYTTPKQFTAKLRCWNAKGTYETTTEVFVHIPIEGFKLDNYTINAVYKDAINIHFSWRQASHMKVIAYAENKLGVVPASKIDYESHSGIIELHGGYFPSPGRYIIHVNASNKVSSLDKPAEATVNIFEKIYGAEVLVNPFVAVSYRLRAYLSVKKGSDMKVTWNFGDGSPHESINCTWKRSCYFDHKYNKTGNYTIKAKARNELSFDEGSGNVTIEYPILGWDFVPEGVSKAGDISQLKLVYNKSFPFPTDATYEITFDQDKDQEKQAFKLTGDVSKIEKHIYQQAGCYRAKVKMENKVSTVVLKTKVKVRGNYTEAEITPTSLKGDGKLPLPLEYPVEFTSNIKNKCLKYNWTIMDTKDSQVLTVNFSKSFKYTFNVSGEYKVNFIAYDSENMDDSITAEKGINVEESVTGLFLSSDGIGEVNKTVNFILLWATLGSSTTFTVHYDSNTKEKQLNLADKTKDFSKYSSKLPFDPKGLEGIIFSHNFSQIREYQVKVKVNSGQNLTTQVFISKAPCPLPDITITGGSKDANSAPQVPYKIQYTLFSTVAATSRPDCNGIRFKWRVFKADEYLLKTTGSSVIPPDDNREIE
jgi:plastocyanin